jgi:hypothetical protein
MTGAGGETTGAAGMGGHGGTGAGGAGTGGVGGTTGTTGAGGTGGHGGVGGTGAVGGAGGVSGTGGVGGAGGVSGTGGVGGAGGTGGVGGAGGSGVCSTQECGPPPPFAYPQCPSGMVTQAYCARGTDGLCHWNGPMCVPCPLIACPAVTPICTAAAPTSACGCPCTPVATQ